MAVPPSANLLPQVSHYPPDAICNIGCGVSNLVIENLISFVFMTQWLDQTSMSVLKCTAPLVHGLIKVSQEMAFSRY